MTEDSVTGQAELGDATLAVEIMDPGAGGFGASAALLRQHLLRLRSMNLVERQKLELLCRLNAYAEEVLAQVWPALWEVSLPLSRKERQPLRAVQDMLEILARDYLDLQTANATASEVEAVDGADAVPRALWRAIRALVRHLQISYLIAAQPTVGIWPLLHTAYLDARRQGLNDYCPAGETQSIEQLYLASLLLGASQPASFSSAELAFVVSYIQQGVRLPALEEAPPKAKQSVFWIDPERDIAAYALARRQPPEDAAVLYFACDPLSAVALRHLSALEGGLTASELDLPAFAATVAGHAVLRRLARLWGAQIKRRFSRRRRSYRATLCPGFDQAWRLVRGQGGEVLHSEWMIINESPDGYAMMHMAGDLAGLQVGDLVCVRQEESERPVWQLCAVRWAISDNPEHVEIGLQIFPPGAEAVELDLPERPAHEPVPALLLPKLPATAGEKMLLAPAGIVRRSAGNFGVTLRDPVGAHRQLHSARLEEQTARIEVFSVASGETL